MYAGIITAVLILICPLFLSVYVNAQKQNKSVNIKITLFGIAVFKLNAKLEGSRLYIKKTFKKPYYLSITKQFGKKNPLKTLPKISVLSLKALINVGITEDVFLQCMTISSLELGKNAAFDALKANKPYLSLSCNLNLYQGCDILEVFLNVKTVFNLVDAIIYIIKILSEKLYYGIGKK